MSSGNNNLQNMINNNINKRFGNVNKLNASIVEDGKKDNLKKINRAQSSSVKFFQAYNNLKRGVTLNGNNQSLRQSNNNSLIFKSTKKNGIK